MKLKLISAVCLAVAAFAASSCKAQAAGDFDRAVDLTRDLAMTLGFCEAELGPDHFPRMKADVAKVFGQDSADSLQVFYDTARQRAAEMPADERANRFTAQACWIRSYELTREMNREIARLPRVSQVAAR